MVFAPHIKMFQPFLLDFKKYDITEGRPKLAAWIEVLKESTSSLPYKNHLEKF